MLYLNENNSRFSKNVDNFNSVAADDLSLRMGKRAENQSSGVIVRKCYIKGSVKKPLPGFSFTHLRIKNYAS